MQGSLFKNYQEFQDGNSRALNQSPGWFWAQGRGRLHSFTPTTSAFCVRVSAFGLADFWGCHRGYWFPDTAKSSFSFLPWWHHLVSSLLVVAGSPRCLANFPPSLKLCSNCPSPAFFLNVYLESTVSNSFNNDNCLLSWFGLPQTDPEVRIWG